MQPHPSPRGLRHQLNRHQTQPGSRTGWTDYWGPAASVLVEAGIETVYPHQFAANTVSAHPHAGVHALREMSNRRTNPPQTLEQILELLVIRHKMTEVAEILLPLLAEMRGDPAEA